MLRILSMEQRAPWKVALKWGGLSALGTLALGFIVPLVTDVPPYAAGYLAGQGMFVAFGIGACFGYFRGDAQRRE